MNVLLVDDDQSCNDTMKKYLESYSFIHVLGEVNNAHDAVKFLQKHKVDVLFLDIEMEGVNGLQLAAHIQSLYRHCLIIFVSGHPGFALEGYEVHPVDFLTKPINVLRLEKALNRVKEIISPTPVEKELKIGMKVAGGMRMIRISDILYIEKQGRKISVVCKNNESFHSGDSMKNLEEIFLSLDFFRCHQSFLMPLQQIKAVNSDTFSRSYTIQLNDSKTELPLSRNKYQDLIELLKERSKRIIW
ncbi:LytR/AlgR family response regulator transcription factor [Brevibacillus reuszeri]|uniref:LytR/AlgR family response regulator transcription factor n=1 Tax=Brevibacillus reuszeri TaxID=54915 RepID=UPI0028979AFA|nr:LytTR family DNA-binding domain-containing protein [Brevibacillus reuszeri]